MPTFKGNLPEVVGAKGGVFNVLDGASITGGNAVHGTSVNAGTTGAFLAGSKLQARALLVQHQTTTVGSSVIEAKVSLMEATDANGTGATAIATATFAITPTAGQDYIDELSLSAVDAAKFYALGVTWKASAGTNNTGTGGVRGFLLDPWIAK